LTYGVNTLGDPDGLYAGKHAEFDALKKLPKIKEKTKKLIDLNILVIRLSTTNKLQNSKPCFNCIKMMKSFPIKKGYIIKNIYYSNDEGEIIKTNLDKLESEEFHYSRFYKRSGNINNIL